MARLAGVDLPNHKRIDIALTSVYGVGRTTAVDLVEKAGIESTKAADLTSDEVNTIRKLIESEGLLVEGDLRREVSLNIKRLVDLGNYRGLRHRRGFLFEVRELKQILVLVKVLVRLLLTRRSNSFNLRL